MVMPGTMSLNRPFGLEPVVASTKLADSYHILLGSLCSPPRGPQQLNDLLNVFAAARMAQAA